MLRFEARECGMHRSNTIHRVSVGVLVAFMLSGGVLGAGFNPFDLATCTARGGKVVSRNDSGDT